MWVSSSSSIFGETPDSSEVVGMAYLLLTTYYVLLTTYYLLLTTYYLLLTTYYLLLTTYYSFGSGPTSTGNRGPLLLTTYCLLPTALRRVWACLRRQKRRCVLSWWALLVKRGSRLPNAEDARDLDSRHF